jgi:hypothetical protein
MIPDPTQPLTVHKRPDELGGTVEIFHLYVIGRPLFENGVMSFETTQAAAELLFDELGVALDRRYWIAGKEHPR